jgi:hypothetical protein
VRVADAELRDRFEWGYDKSEALAAQGKDSNLAVGYFKNFFRTIDESERPSADAILAEWALSPDDDARRFVALAIIDEFKVVSALPSLRALAERFELADGPAAPYDWAKVNRIIGRLATA